MKNNMRRSLVLLAASATAVSTVLGALTLTGPAEATERTRAGPSACRGTAELTVTPEEGTCLSWPLDQSRARITTRPTGWPETRYRKAWGA